MFMRFKGTSMVVDGGEGDGGEGHVPTTARETLATSAEGTEARMQA